MLPEEFQDIYDDTIPEAKEVRKKMGKKTSSAPSYSCAMPMLDDIRSLDYKDQAKVCKAFHQYLTKSPLAGKPPIQRKVGWMKNIIFATVLKFT